MLALPRLAQVAGRGALRSAQGCCLARVPAGAVAAAFPSTRGVTSAAATKVVKTLQAELKHEEENYEQAKEVKKFLKGSEFKLVDTDGDVNMTLEREVGEKLIRIEWQLTNPFNPEENEEGAEGNMEQEATDFCVTVENKSSHAGMTFYCSTQTGEDHRFVIGNVKTFASAEEKDNIGAYSGPEFEDIDEKLQEAFDEYLAEVGLNNEVCDFIDAVALDKEQREYIRWLKCAKQFLEA